MESLFQFTNPTLTGLEFGLNEAFDNRGSVEIQTKMEISVQTNREKKQNEATVSLKIKLGEKSEKNPFYIVAEEKANFRWEDGLDESMVTALLQQNAPALLLSYLRPVIVQITAASPYEAYNIPFIDFTETQK